MLKKIISGVLALGMLTASASAFACSCGEQYRTYEYTYLGDSKHQVSYSCSNRACDDPFTVVGSQDCVPYEYYYDQFDNVSRYWCDVCHAPLPSVYH